MPESNDDALLAL